MLVTLDANILLSALLSPRGVPAQLLEAWERRKFTLISCDVLVDELLAVAARPFFRARLRPGVAELLAASVRELSLFMRDLPTGPVAHHPKDSYPLALAAATHADFLVTGDKQLLSLKHQASTHIVTAAFIFDLLKRQGQK
jgi:uncharacterized protein